MMLQSYKNLHVHIEDSGLFTEAATLLAKHFGRVTYTSPWISGFPASAQDEVGEGMAKVERVEDIDEVDGEVDLYCFFDIYASHTQARLQETGKRVWGSRHADELERFRIAAKHYFEKLGIPIGPYQELRGIAQLRAYLKKRGKADLFVKVDEHRGDFETFPSESYELTKNKLDEIEARLGPKADELRLIVEDKLENTIDIAIDTFCIDGQYPELGILGIEEKGECYIGAVKRWTQMPSQLRASYQVLSDTFAHYQYRNFLSLESRVRKGETFLVDPCCRAGSPPFELQLNMIQNLPDILWQGADGILLEPDIPARYGVELIIHSDWANEHPLLVDFPPKLRDRIKFRYNAEFGGETWIMPQKAGPRIAAVVEYGNDLEDLIDQAKEDASQIKGIQVENFSRSFPIALDKLKELKQMGISF